MEAVNRRSTLALGLTMAATPLIAWVTPAAAQTYGPDEGEEIGPGVRVVALGERASVIPAYKMVKLRDVVIQAGAKTPDNVMTNDMLCHMTEGERDCQEFCAVGHDDEKERIITWLSRKNFWTSSWL
ncbi:hypothetical protein, partial [Sinorhizobium meliloti]